MHHTIYPDVLICVNLFINYFILLSVTKILHLKVTRLRLVIAALLGSAYSLFILLPPVNVVLSLIVKIIMSVTICMVAFGLLDFRSLAKTMIMFYCISFLFCAFIFFIQHFLAPIGIFMKNGVVYFKLSPLFLVVSTIIIYMIIRVSDRFLDRTEPPSESCLIIVEHNGKTATLKGKIDTGNTLKEPFSNLPVIVAEYKHVYSVIPDDELCHFEHIGINSTSQKCLSKNFRLVPFSTISESGILPAFKPERIKISYLGKTFQKDAFICTCNKDILGGSFNALVPPELID